MTLDTQRKVFPHLVGNDIYVRLARPGDEAALTTYFKDNRTFHKPFDPNRSEAFFTETGWHERLEQLHYLHKRDMAYYFLIFKNDGVGKVCGVISYSNLTRYPFYACTLGYSLDEVEQGQGLMHQALLLTNEWMFVEQNMHRIMANYMPHNRKSAYVLKRLGFEIEGHAKDYLLINGEWQDHVLTSLINKVWQGKK